mgnify:CR=1 FL=1
MTNTKISSPFLPDKSVTNLSRVSLNGITVSSPDVLCITTATSLGFRNTNTTLIPDILIYSWNWDVGSWLTMHDEVGVALPFLTPGGVWEWRAANRLSTVACTSSIPVINMYNIALKNSQVIWTFAMVYAFFDGHTWFYMATASSQK